MTKAKVFVLMPTVLKISLNVSNQLSSEGGKLRSLTVWVEAVTNRIALMMKLLLCQRDLNRKEELT